MDFTNDGVCVTVRAMDNDLNTIPIADLSRLLCYATRYALGQRSYIATWANEQIRMHAFAFHPQYVDTLINDIEQYGKQASYGDAMDDILWTETLMYLKALRSTHYEIDLWKIAPMTYRASLRSTSPSQNTCCVVCNTPIRETVTIWFDIPMTEVHEQCRPQYATDIVQHIIHGIPVVRVPLHTHCVKKYIPTQHCDNVDKLIGLCILTAEKREHNG